MPVGSSLPGSYNYVRNSVKVVIDAYSGQMTFYAIDPNDPILQAYEAAFPHMFTPLSKMSPQLQAHLRYPADIFSIQSAIYGRYHLTTPRLLHRQQRLAPLADRRRRAAVAGAAGREHLQHPGAAGLDDPGRMAPLYQVYSLPGTPRPTSLHDLRRLRARVAVDASG